MTRLLCLENSYLKECSSSVISATGKELVLETTVFYPRGGGQPSDTGKIITNEGQIRSVVSVFKREGAVVHELNEEISGIAQGDSVKCVIDWERRYKLMKMHTAAHVLAAVMHRELGVLISGNQLEEDKARFDFNLAEFDREKFDYVVKKANELISTGIEIKVYELPRQEAMKIPGIVKLAGALPPLIEVLRIVEIPGIDIQADGGTHVKNLKEIGSIEILRLDNKGKDNKRIYFTLVTK